MNRKKVLLVEDDKSFANLMTHWLEKERNFEVVTVGDGDEAARLAGVEKWQLVISDVNLPGMEGVELARHFKSQSPQSPFLLITAQQSMDCVIRALQNRVDDFLPKPFTCETLIAKADELIARARLEEKKSGKTILAIGAHPDDVEIACGGLLLRHKANGDHIRILTLTDGQEGGLQSKRFLESEAAADKLDARLFWGGLRDTRVGEGLETISVIEQVIALVKPAAIYTHTQNDAHQDHRNAFLATLVAARKVPSLYCYQSPSSTINFQPNRFVEINEHLEEKLDLISAYESQVTKCSYLDPELIRATARYWGRFAGNKLIEPLEVIRESH